MSTLDLVVLPFGLVMPRAQAKDTKHSGMGAPSISHQRPRRKSLPLEELAHQALSIGLVEFVVPDDELLERALEIGVEIASKSAAAIAASKRCVNVGLNDGIAAGLALELEPAVEVGLSADAAEGQAAFIEKRRPCFDKGRSSKTNDASNVVTDQIVSIECAP